MFCTHFDICTLHLHRDVAVDPILIAQSIILLRRQRCYVFIKNQSFTSVKSRLLMAFLH